MSWSQPNESKNANAMLQKKLISKAFRRRSRLNRDGTVVWTQVGCLAGGPPALIAKLDEAKKK
jgi:hypothetical protein